MHYLLMLYAREAEGLKIAPEQMARVMDDMGAYQAALEKADAFVMTSPLDRTRNARTLRPTGGEIRAAEGSAGPAFRNDGGALQVENGPYADTLEQLGGFFIIAAADMDAAIDWARKCPAAQWGPIEIRAMKPGF
jgi:hypothetical protein